jgi:hypothetical protein
MPPYFRPKHHAESIDQGSPPFVKQYTGGRAYLGGAHLDHLGALDRTEAQNMAKTSSTQLFVYSSCFAVSSLGLLALLAPGISRIRAAPLGRALAFSLDFHGMLHLLQDSPG